MGIMVKNVKHRCTYSHLNGKGRLEYEKRVNLKGIPEFAVDGTSTQALRNVNTSRQAGDRCQFFTVFPLDAAACLNQSHAETTGKDWRGESGE